MPTAPIKEPTVSLERYAVAHGRKCPVCELPPEWRQTVDKHLSARSYSRPFLEGWLKSEGFEVDKRALRSHLDNGHIDA